MRRQAKAGFSLIEMLVVIVIIAILIALLMPLFGGFKERASRVTCKTRLRQLVTAVASHASNHDGRLLPGYRYKRNPAFVDHDDGWCLNETSYEIFRDEYLGGEDRMFVCPNVERLAYTDWRGQPFSFPEWWGGGGGPTYLLGYNYFGNKPGLNNELVRRGYRFQYPGIRVLTEDARTTPLFSDFNRWTPTFSRAVVAHTAYGGLRVVPQNLDAVSAGSEGGNFAYAAGHVTWRPAGELVQVPSFASGGAVVWDLLPDEVRTR